MSVPAGPGPADGGRSVERGDAVRGMRASEPPARGGGSAPRSPVAAETGGPDEPPPILGRWSRLYALVVLELVVVIAVLFWLTRRYM